ncbi:MAG: NAD(P)-dependent oxidoreductase [Bacteroidetes bacterium GWF2_43_63]|nr:MAG: NAD(P)-dependent oxidoreductase [Bacteroidetes bacterium GWE2_42_42]OFY56282.1 MAG: NAD(P)-dependent oxidoreductase [Bacteroidetes bacterium GWF2_43_63]HBG71961.1 NAD(P)-dependent oxidoreductase [Bacteroidales bacterium]HCB61862.1 NAD(P)-dependent oxidoreductase [Bacteroidales bacterium]HCY23884.1 NAD(P)-dependent oxidoreductase [Bacteroidales bacterium]
MNKIILVSGATSGIGESCVKKFAASGNRVILCGRRSERLSQLKDSLVSQYGDNFLTLSFDIRVKDDVVNAIDSLPVEWKAIDVLVNNAGLARGLSSLQEGNIDHWEQMIDTNVKGLLYLTRAVVGQMIERKSGHVINLGSIAGRQSYANGNVYCATKAAVDSLTKSMRIDFLPHNVKVSQVAPGAVETEFSLVRFEGDQQRAADVYKGFTPLTPDDVAEAVHYIASLPPHVNVNDILLMPAAQACAGVIHKE